MRRIIQCYEYIELVIGHSVRMYVQQFQMWISTIRMISKYYIFYIQCSDCTPKKFKTIFMNIFQGDMMHLQELNIVGGWALPSICILGMFAQETSICSHKFPSRNFMTKISHYGASPFLTAMQSSRLPSHRFSFSQLMYVQSIPCHPRFAYYRQPGSW